MVDCGSSVKKNVSQVGNDIQISRDNTLVGNRRATAQEIVSAKANFGFILESKKMI